MKIKNKILIAAWLLTCLTSSISQGRVSIIGGLSHEKKAVLGEIYKGSIIIKNSDTKTQEIKVYQTDYLYFCNGKNDYGPPGELKRSNAKWLSFSPNRIIIPAESTAALNYTLTVPDDSNLTGTYWSMLMIEQIPETSPESSQAEEIKPQVGITQIVRYGIQMVTHIEDTGERKLKFLETKLLRQTEKRVLQVDLENIGERWMRPYLWVELYDDAGRYIGKFENEKKRIYPTTSVRFEVDLSSVPQGVYQSLIVADCGGDDIFGANLTLKLDE